MPAIQRSEFALALNQVSNERGLDPAVVLETVENAILAAYRKDHPEAELEEFTAVLNPNTGEAKIFHDKKDVTPPGFGRIAAQTAKQVILQKIREKEKEAVISDFRLKIGTIVNGMVLRFAGPNVIVDIGKTEALMPVSEQIQNEKYHLNQRLTVYIVEIKEGLRGEEVVVSRSSTGLLEGLFKREVPEVAQGAVEIKAIEREAGNRSKVAVYSNQSGIDPVGSCVGQKGVRVQAIIAEFNGIEKIDIIQWQEIPKNYIAQALSPAKEVRVEVVEEEKLAHVFVAPQELSLAIGKDGQNVRLASKLTGYRIEIEEDPNAPKIDLPASASEALQAGEAVPVKVKEQKEEKAAEVAKEDVVAKNPPSVEPEEVAEEAGAQEPEAQVSAEPAPQDSADAVESAVAAEVTEESQSESGDNSLPHVSGDAQQSNEELSSDSASLNDSSAPISNENEEVNPEPTISSPENGQTTVSTKSSKDNKNKKKSNKTDEPK